MDNIQEFLNTIANGQDTKPSDVTVPTTTSMIHHSIFHMVRILGTMNIVVMIHRTIMDNF